MAKAKTRGDLDNQLWIEVQPLIRHTGVNFQHWDGDTISAYKTYYKLSKVQHQNKEKAAKAVARHFKVNAVDDVSVLQAFLDEVKSSQDSSFDASKAQNRIIRHTTAWDGPRGGRVAPYKSATKAYKTMIEHALKKLGGRRGTYEEIANVIEAEFGEFSGDCSNLGGHVAWVQHGRKRPWKRTLKKRLETLPEVKKDGQDAKGNPFYTMAKLQQKAGAQSGKEGLKIPVKGGA